MSGHGGHVHPGDASLQRRAQLPPASAGRHGRRRVRWRDGHVGRGPLALHAPQRGALPADVGAGARRRLGHGVGPLRPHHPVQKLLLLLRPPRPRHRGAVLSARPGQPRQGLRRSADFSSPVPLVGPRASLTGL